MLAARGPGWRQGDTTARAGRMSWGESGPILTRSGLAGGYRLRVVSRRTVLWMAGGGLAALAAGCGRDEGAILPGVHPGTEPAETPPEPEATATPPTATTAGPATVAPSPTPTPTTEPVPPAGSSTRALMAGTPHETIATITHSGIRGPVMMVLGGVHGNEPGGRIAAEEVAAWVPVSGSLVVVPRCNEIAIQRWERSGEDLGDLNRLYPGDPQGALPMARMAAEIVGLAREMRVAVLLDLHESWAFFSTRTQSGTAFLGQTITAGVGPHNPALSLAIVERVNATIRVERDQLIHRDGSAFRRQDVPAFDGLPAATTRGRSSLALGGFIAGLTPVLVEMGQEGQALERRVELHEAVVRAAMNHLGMA